MSNSSGPRRCPKVELPLAWTTRSTRARPAGGEATQLDGDPGPAATHQRQPVGVSDRSLPESTIDADVFPWKPDRTWDVCVFCFSGCHVPDEQLARFAATVSTAVPTTRLAAFSDKPLPPSPTPTAPTR